MAKHVQTISECRKLIRKANEENYYRQGEEDIIYQFILDNELCTEGELQMACDVGGFNTETLNYVIYRQTGYHDIPQLYDTTDERKTLYFNDDVMDYYDFNSDKNGEE